MTDPPSAIRNNVGNQRFEADLGDGSLAIADYRLGEGTIAFTTRRCRLPTGAAASAPH